MNQPREFVPLNQSFDQEATFSAPPRLNPKLEVDGREPVVEPLEGRSPLPYQPFQIKQTAGDLVQLQRHIQLLDEVANLSQTLLATTNLIEGFQQVVEKLGHATNSDRVVIARLDWTPDDLECYGWQEVVTEWRQVDSVRYTTPELRRFPIRRSLSGVLRAILSGRNVFVIEECPEPFRSEQKCSGVVWNVSVLIRCNSETWGIIGFDHSTPLTEFDQADVAVLKTAAAAIASAIERHKSEEHRRAAEIALMLERERAAQIRAIELERKDALLRAVVEATRRMVEQDDFGCALSSAITALGELTGLDRVYVIHYDHSYRAGFFIAEWNAPDIETLAATVGWGPFHFHEYREVFEPLMSNQPYSSPAHLKTGANARLNLATHNKSDIFVPIFLDGVFWGAIGFDDCYTERFYSDSEIQVLRGAATAISSALHRREIERQRTQAERAILVSREQTARELADELSKANAAIQRSVTHLTSMDNLNDFLNAVLLESIQASGAVSGAIFVYDPGSQALYIQAHVIRGELIDIHQDARNWVFQEPIQVDGDLVWEIMARDRQVLWADYQRPQATYLPQFRTWHEVNGHRLVAIIPMMQGHEIIGFAGLAYDQSLTEPPPDSRLELPRALVQQAALAVRLTQLADQAKQAAKLEERNRIARDIHDTMGQSFTGIVIQLQALERVFKSDTVQAIENLQIAIDLAQDGLLEARRSVQALRPLVLESVSLANSLRRMLDAMTHGTSVCGEFALFGIPSALPDSVTTTLLRCGQEAVTNALRHAHPSQLRLELTYDSAGLVSLSIEDNGCGFDPQTVKAGLGLTGMQERADQIGATLTLTSQPAQGTKVILHLVYGDY